MRFRRAADARSDEPFEFSLFDASSSVAYLEVSPTGTVRHANPYLASLLGADSERSLTGRPLTEIVVERSSWPTCHAAALAGRERSVRLTFRGPKGRIAVLKGDLLRPRHAEDDSLVGIFVDIGEEERLRGAVQRGARMEALGSLTSGIAHDFNNLLTVLVGNLYLVAEELRDDRNTFPKLKAARDAAKRGSDLIRQLLAFARRESLEADVVDPAKVLAGLVPLLSRALGSKISLDAQLSPDAGRVRCNAAQLESVVVNLSVNARDAIEESGRIVVAVNGAQIGSADAERRRVPPGAYVEVSVSDDGSGIPADTVEHVFEPFFTTKTDRGGTGLGLSMVRWFAQQAGGTVYIRSAPGQGTKVSLLLPQSADQTAETSARTAPLSTLAGGDESVLVFARDESLRTTIKQILEVLGYDVHTTTDTSDTLQLLRSKQMQMLLLDGAAQHDAARQQLLRAALDARPGIKIIVTVDAADAGRVKRSSGAPWLLGKPFSIGDLAGAVRRALDEGR